MICNLKLGMVEVSDTLPGKKKNVILAFSNNFNSTINTTVKNMTDVWAGPVTLLCPTVGKN